MPITRVISIFERLFSIIRFVFVCHTILLRWQCWWLYHWRNTEARETWMSVAWLFQFVWNSSTESTMSVRPSVCLILMRQRRVSIMAGKSRPVASVRLAVLSDMWYTRYKLADRLQFEHRHRLLGAVVPQRKSSGATPLFSPPQASKNLAPICNAICGVIYGSFYRKWQIPVLGK